MVIYIYSQTQTPCGIPWNWKTQVVEILSASRCENIDLKMHLAGEAVAAENLCWKTGKDEDLTIKHGVFNHQTWRIWPSNMVVQLFIWPAMLCWPTKENSTQRWTLPSWTAGIMSTFFFFAMVKVLQPFAVPHVGTHLEGQGMVAMNLEVWRWTRPINHDGWKIHIIMINSKIVTQVKTCENYFWFSRCSKISGNCKFRKQLPSTAHILVPSRPSELSLSFCDLRLAISWFQVGTRPSDFKMVASLCHFMSIQSRWFAI